MFKFTKIFSRERIPRRENDLFVAVLVCYQLILEIVFLFSVGIGKINQGFAHIVFGNLGVRTFVVRLYPACQIHITIDAE